MCCYLKLGLFPEPEIQIDLSAIPSSFLSVGYQAFVHIMNSDILIADLYLSGRCCHNLCRLTVDYYVGLSIVDLLFFISVP